MLKGKLVAAFIFNQVDKKQATKWGENITCTSVHHMRPFWAVIFRCRASLMVAANSQDCENKLTIARLWVLSRIAEALRTVPVVETASPTLHQCTLLWGRSQYQELIPVYQKHIFFMNRARFGSGSLPFYAGGGTLRCMGAALSARTLPHKDAAEQLKIFSEQRNGIFFPSTTWSPTCFCWRRKYLQTSSKWRQLQQRPY